MILASMCIAIRTLEWKILFCMYETTYARGKFTNLHFLNPIYPEFPQKKINILTHDLKPWGGVL